MRCPRWLLRQLFDTHCLAEGIELFAKALQQKAGEIICWVLRLLRQPKWWPNFLKRRESHERLVTIFIALEVSLSIKMSALSFPMKPMHVRFLAIHSLSSHPSMEGFSPWLCRALHDFYAWPHCGYCYSCRFRTLLLNIVILILTSFLLAVDRECDFFWWLIPHSHCSCVLASYHDVPGYLVTHRREKYCNHRGEMLFMWHSSIKLSAKLFIAL